LACHPAISVSEIENYFYPYKQQQQQPQQSPFYDYYTGQPALAGTSSQELEDFVGAKFYYPEALADSKQQYIGIGENMLEFSSTMLSTVSAYLLHP